MNNLNDNYIFVNNENENKEFQHKNRPFMKIMLAFVIVYMLY